MPALPMNPSLMTKERLAEALRKNNIPLPRGRSKKEAYVELYQRHLLDKEAASPQWASYRNMSVNTSPKLGFSSDEEDEVAVKIRKTAVMNVNNNRSQKRATKKGNQSEFEDRLAEVEGLADADLRKELQNRGVKPGPIVASTRAVYERKLADLLLQPEQQQEEEAEDDEDVSQEEAMEYYDGDSQENEDQYSDSDVDDGEDGETQSSSRSVNSRTTSSYKSRVTRLIDQESSSKARQRSVAPKTKTKTTSSSAEKTAEKTTATQRREERGKSLVPVWLQILIFLIVTAFLVLIWYNMETGQSEGSLVT